MDVTGGCIKSVVFHVVLSENFVIHFPEDFAGYADSKIKVVSALFIPMSEIRIYVREPDFIRRTPQLESICTLQVNIFNSFKTKAAFCYLQFFLKIATDNIPFYTHWYHHPGDLTDQCGHMDLQNEKYSSCFQGETGSSRICCPLFSQWYHDCMVVTKLVL